MDRLCFLSNIHTHIDDSNAKRRGSEEGGRNRAERRQMAMLVVDYSTVFLCRKAGIEKKNCGHMVSEFFKPCSAFRLFLNNKK